MKHKSHRTYVAKFEITNFRANLIVVVLRVGEKLITKFVKVDHYIYKIYISNIQMFSIPITTIDT